MNKSMTSRRSAAALAAAVTLVSASHVWGQVTSVTEQIWDGGGTPGATGSYVNPSNWNPDAVPTNTANQFLEINDGGTATITTGDAAQGTFLALGLKPGNVGHLTISDGSLTVGEMRVGGRETIANGFTNIALGVSPNGGGIGSVLQTGGIVNVTYQDASATEPPIQSLYVGDAGLTTGNTAAGSYTISGGSLTSGIANNDSIVVGTGDGTTGTFVQSGATTTVTSTGFVTVARSGAKASYSISGGTLNVGTGTAASSQNLWVGDGATTDGTAAASGTTIGTFTQTGGDVIVKSAVEIGRRNGTGVYTISAGTLTSGAELRVGTNGNTSVAALFNGTGTLNVSGAATINIGTNFHLGLSNATTANACIGTVNMSGGTINANSSGAIWAVGNGQASTGTFTHTGGTVNATSGTLNIGRNRGQGIYALSGSGVLNLNILTIDSSSPAAASTREFRIDGGTASITTINNGTVTPTNLTRSFTMTGGTLTVSGNTIGGKGVIWDISGGVSTFTGTVTMDTSPLTIRGTADVTMPSLTTGTGLFTYTGGSLKCSTILTLSTGGTMKTDNNLSLTGVANFNVGNATINVNSGTLTIPNLLNNNNRTLTKTGPGTLTISGTQAIAGTIPTLNVNAGIVNLNSNANGTGTENPGLLVLNVNSTTNFGAAQGLATLNVANGAVATLTANPTPLATNKAINVTTLGTITNGKLDLTNGKLRTATAIGIWDGSNYTGVLGMVKSGRNNGDWSGNGIVTSQSAALAANPVTTLAVSTGADVKGISETTTALWGGQTVSATDTLVMYTYNGDMNLDGKVNADDYFIIDSNYSKSGTVFGYAAGDLNYDGAINGDDYFQIDTGFAGQGAAFATASGEVLGGVSAVPEPASLAFLGIVAMGLKRRRRHD